MDESWTSRKDWVEKRVQPERFGRALKASEVAQHTWAERYGKWLVIVIALIGTVAQLVRAPTWNSLGWFLGAAVFAWLVIWMHRKTQVWERPLVSATLELKEVPLRLGGVLEAKLRLSTAPPRVGRPRLLLRSIRRSRIPRVGADSTEDETLWQRAQSIEAGAARQDGEGHFIPVHFEIPANEIPSAAHGREGRAHISTVWTLELHAEPNDVPVECVFEIPVLGDADTDYGERLASRSRAAAPR